MNLAEFPFATLRSRADNRKSLTYEGWITDKDGNRLQQKWVVQGGSLLGLPTEFDERVYVALMAVAAERGFESRKVPFSVYAILKIMGLPDNNQGYRSVETSLERLAGVTIKAQGAFWDNEHKELIITKTGFHIIEKYWLRSRETSERIREQEAVPAYILWSEDIWKSIQSGYIKSLDIGFYYGLESPIARRLYRLLDKRLWNKTEYEFDVFDLAGKLGMVSYKFPAEIRKKIKPAVDELVAQGFLARTVALRANGYSRIRFIKAAHPPTALPLPPAPAPVSQEPGDLPDPEREVEDLTRVLQEIGMTAKAARHLVDTYPAEQIDNWLAAAEWESERGKSIKNRAAYIRRALEQSWPLPQGFKTRAQRAQEEIDEEQRRRDVALALAEQQALDLQLRDEAQQQAAALNARLAAQYGTTAADLDLWVQAQEWIKNISGSMGQPDRWLAGTYLLTIQNGMARIGVPHKDAAVYLSRMANQELIRSALKSLSHPVTALTFEVLPQPLV